jgi:Tat protein secretion system quality control protein TatD with DNase activity
MRTLEALAQARDEDPKELEQQIDRNASECFGL